MSLNTNWEYRVVRKKDKTESDFFSIQEVYFDDDGNHLDQSNDIQVDGQTLTEMRKQLQRMSWALDKEVVDEIESVNVDEIDDELKTEVIGTVELPNDYWE